MGIAQGKIRNKKKKQGRSINARGGENAPSCLSPERHDAVEAATTMRERNANERQMANEDKKTTKEEWTKKAKVERRVKRDTCGDGSQPTDDDRHPLELSGHGRCRSWSTFLPFWHVLGLLGRI